MDEQPVLACANMTALFFSPEVDGRNEEGRVEREARARSICWTECQYRLICLSRAIRINEYHGVWGGMSEHERRDFRKHWLAEGYEIEDLPRYGEDTTELRTSVTMFYRNRRANSA